MPENHRLYVLDTNVLMHDPMSLFRFKEHDLFIPMVVLEELDAAKKGTSEVARNVRQVSRFLDGMMNGAGEGSMNGGLPLTHPFAGALPENTTGHLYFQTEPVDAPAHGLLNGKADHQILANVLALQKKYPDRQITLISKDINLRIKASILGIPSEDYQNDRALDDFSIMYTGVEALDEGFWSRHGESVESWTEQGRTYYRFPRTADLDWHPGQCLYLSGEGGFEAIVSSCDGDSCVVRIADDYTTSHRNVWGIQARNREQSFALNLLMDTDVDFVTLLGTAGTGKTLLALAAGLAQTLDEQLYREIIMTRATVPVGEDIGFLPGTEEEKMTPWMGALMDNLEVLTNQGATTDWGRAATNDLLNNRIKIRSLNFMRGRTFLNRYVIIDEAQNLTPKQMKTLVTRAGSGTKVVCLGNVEQIDSPYLTETTSGVTYAVSRFRDWSHSGHVTLVRGERSRLADFASDVL